MSINTNYIKVDRAWTSLTSRLQCYSRNQLRHHDNSDTVYFLKQIKVLATTTTTTVWKNSKPIFMSGAHRELFFLTAADFLAVTAQKTPTDPNYRQKTNDLRTRSIHLNPNTFNHCITVLLSSSGSSSSSASSSSSVVSGRSQTSFKGA